MHITELNRLAAVGDQRTTDTMKPSKALWKKCPYFELSHGLRDGFTFFDNFLGNFIQAANVANTATTVPQPWAAFTGATADTIAVDVSPTDAVGAAKLIATTAQESAQLALYSGGLLAAPIPALSATNRVWWEARVKTDSITTQNNGFYAGLNLIGKVVTLGTLATLGDAVSAWDHIGFMKQAVTAPSKIQTVMGNGTSTIVNATAGTLVANTYVNLGFSWDGPGNIGRWFINGAADSTSVNISSTQFPAGSNLCLQFGNQAGTTGTAFTLYIDWARIAFERVSS